MNTFTSAQSEWSENGLLTVAEGTTFSAWPHIERSSQNRAAATDLAEAELPEVRESVSSWRDLAGLALLLGLAWSLACLYGWAFYTFWSAVYRAAPPQAGWEIGYSQVSSGSPGSDERVFAPYSGPENRSRTESR